MAKPACADRPLRWAAARHPHPGVVDLDAAPAKAAAAAPPSLHRADRHAAANAWCISDVAATVPMPLYLQAAAAVVFVLPPVSPEPVRAQRRTPRRPRGWRGGSALADHACRISKPAGLASGRLPCAARKTPVQTQRDARATLSLSGRAQGSWLIKKGIGLSRFLGDAILPRLTTGRRTRMDLHTSARTHTRTIPSPFIRSHSQPHSNSLLAIT